MGAQCYSDWVYGLRLFTSQCASTLLELSFIIDLGPTLYDLSVNYRGQSENKLVVDYAVTRQHEESPERSNFVKRHGGRHGSPHAYVRASVAP